MCVCVCVCVFAFVGVKRNYGNVYANILAHIYPYSVLVENINIYIYALWVHEHT